MTVELIKELLEYSECDGFEITETVTRGWEFYFIGHHLDQNRVRDVKHILVKVFKVIGDQEFLGSATGEIYPTSSKEEAQKMIDKLILEAKYVKNKFYTLNAPSLINEPKQAKVDVKAIAYDYMEALKSVNETNNEFINSYEIFVSEIKRRIVNSEGIDYSVTYPNSAVEVVVNAKDKDHEIELYRMYHSGSCDKKNLILSLEETMKYGKDRLNTIPTPPLEKSAVVFSSEAVLPIYEYFFDRLSSTFVYYKFSNFEIGKEISDKVKGDKITLNALAELPNSSMNVPFDNEGAYIYDRCLMKENVPMNYYGNRQFSCYLGLKNSSQVYNYRVEPGSKSANELRKGDFLEVIDFSDFQCDPITGDIAGEIRLAYYHHDNEVSVVSGGSISGNMRELLNEMYLSKELRQYDTVQVPSVTRIENVTVTGIKG